MHSSNKTIHQIFRHDLQPPLVNSKVFKKATTIKYYCDLKVQYSMSKQDKENANKGRFTTL